MKSILRTILHICSYWLSLFVLDYYHIVNAISFQFTAQSRKQYAYVYFLIGFVFRFCFVIVKKILQILSFPLQIITLWLINFVIGIIVLYLCQYLIGTYLTGITMTISSLPWLMIISFILSVLVSFVYFILKNIFA